MPPEFDILTLDQKPGRTASVKGKEYLFFSGYNYLGINSDPEFIELVNEGTAKYGWLFPSSRISNTRLAIYEECEALLSSITGSEDTILLPSGFAAGRLAIGYQKHSVNNAPGSHPAILQQRSPLSSFRDWAGAVIQHDALLKGEESVIATDSVNPFNGTIHDFSFLRKLKNPVTAIIDDSHAIGITGKNGTGVSSLVPHNLKVNYLFTYSLGKAFGIAGGAISCSKELVKKFKTKPEYAGVTPLSPAQVFAFVKGQHIYTRQRQKLEENTAYLKTALKNLKEIHYCDGLPVFILPTRVNEDLFFQNNILISSFAYPDPKGPTLKRIVLNALHTKEDLDKLVHIMEKACAQLTPKLTSLSHFLI